MISKTKNLSSTFPSTIDAIRLYMDLDKDFKRMCSDFEEVSEIIKYFEKSELKELSNTKNQIEKYKQLQTALITEINNFIIEEINT